jgi:hypothetical protein
MLSFLVPVLFTFYIQGVLKKLKISGAKRLKSGSLNLLESSGPVQIRNWIASPPSVYSVLEEAHPTFVLKLLSKFQAIFFIN